MSIPTFELLATVHDQKVVEINTKFVELTWHRILARIILCSNDGQSYFWRKSAGVLLSTFIIKVIKTKVFTDFLGLNYVQTNQFALLIRYSFSTCLTILFALNDKKRTIFSRIIVFHQKGCFSKIDDKFLPISFGISNQLLISGLPINI